MEHGAMDESIIVGECLSIVPSPINYGLQWLSVDILYTFTVYWGWQIVIDGHASQSIAAGNGNRRTRFTV